MIKKNKSFLLASFIYFFNSIGNVSQGVFIKYYGDILHINLYQFLFIRSVIGILLLLPFNIKYIKQQKIKTLPIVLFLAFLTSLDVILWNTGLQTVQVNTGTLIMLLIPLWVVLLGYFLLKERGFKFINLISLLLCFIAVSFTVEGAIGLEKGKFNVGYLLILINTIIVALGLILQKKFSTSRPVVYALFTNCLVLGFLCLIFSNFAIPTVNFHLVKVAILITMFDIMECAAVYVAYNMTNVALLQPIRFSRIIISAIMSYFILSENVTKNQIISAIIIIFANLLPVIYTKLLKYFVSTQNIKKNYHNAK